MENGNQLDNDDIVTLQVNTGNGRHKLSDERLKLIVSETKAKIVIISKSNINVEDVEETDKRAKSFPGFAFEDKLKNSNITACLSTKMMSTQQLL